MDFKWIKMYKRKKRRKKEEKNHLGGTTQDVERLTSKIVTLYTLGFLDIFFALMTNTMCLKHLEASHIMSCDS